MFISTLNSVVCRTFLILVLMLLHDVIAAELTHDHSHHKAMMKKSGYSKLTADYYIPTVDLVDQDGKTVNLRKLLEADQATLLQFIFTTCTTICPVMSASFDGIEDDLKTLGIPFQMVSISIDPEHDTPSVLNDYARKFNAGNNWHFLTGADEDIMMIQKAFDSAYAGNNKMYHQPYTYLRSPGAGSWTRLNGMVSALDLKYEYETLINKNRIPQ